MSREQGYSKVITSKRVAFHTLGCRLNFSDSGSIIEGFKKRGHTVVPFGEPADIMFINTCTVTNAADSTCRHIIRKAHRINPEAQLIVSGCYAQMEPQYIAKMQGVDLVLGTSEKHKVFQYLEEEASQVVATDQTATFYESATSFGHEHTRAFLKIQDGCNYICSFCIIPQARGRGRAIAPIRALEAAKKLIAQGFKEIVLTGVNIGEYERDSGEKLADLLKMLFSLRGLQRLRLSSLEPNTVTSEILEILASSPKFMDHFHLPLQSGSNTILKSMRRRYNISEYQKTLDNVLKYFPRAGIGTDVIVGFPGESEEDFEQTKELLDQGPFSHFHIFPYSRRKNTPAAKQDNHIPHPEKKRRCKILRELGEKKSIVFSQKQSGCTNAVLFEEKSKNGYWKGHTTNFVPVFMHSKENLKNQIHKLSLKHNGEQLEGIPPTQKKYSIQNAAGSSL